MSITQLPALGGQEAGLTLTDVIGIAGRLPGSCTRKELLPLHVSMFVSCIRQALSEQQQQLQHRPERLREMRAGELV